MRIGTMADPALRGELEARRQFFLLNDWCRTQRYVPNKSEWRLIQQVYDELFFRYYDNYFLLGFSLAFPWRNRAAAQFYRRYAFPVFVGLWTAEYSWQYSRVDVAASAFWKCVKHLASPLGAAARALDTLEERRKSMKVGSRHHHEDPEDPTLQRILKKIKNDRRMESPSRMDHLKARASHLIDNNPILSQLMSCASVFFLYNTVTSFFNGTSVFHPTFGQAGSTDIIQLRICTRFFAWTPFRWRQKSNDDELTTTLEVEQPIFANVLPLVTSTLPNANMLRERCSHGSWLWWRMHLWAFSKLS